MLNLSPKCPLQDEGFNMRIKLRDKQKFSFEIGSSKQYLSKYLQSLDLDTSYNMM